MTYDEGRSLATKFGCPFIETSAAHRRHVDEVFQALVREIRVFQVRDHSLMTSRKEGIGGEILPHNFC